MFDPNSFIHILHGILLHLMAGNFVSLWLGLALAILTEVSWEVLENTNFWMEKIRGKERNEEKKSIQHVIGAAVCCVLGYLFSNFFHNIGAWWFSIVWIVASEVGCLMYMRDNLVILVVLMISDMKDIRKWQEKGVPQGKKFLKLVEYISWVFQ